MRRLPGFALASLALLTPALADSPVVRLVEFETDVNPITALRITRAIDEAEQQSDSLVLIRLDTPGGLVTSMETIVKRMLAAQVPVVVWVGPSGAKAASAGLFILMAADVAAMAPGTRTGAASTVFGTGESGADNVHLKKANEDLAALIRSIADRRGRNAEACEKAVFAAKAYEETVALNEGLIEIIAGNTDDLLEQLDGREVQRFDGTSVVLETAGATLVTSEFSYKQEFFEVLANPTVAYLLLLLGVGGLYVEFNHPGLVFPAVIGVLCLILFAFAYQVLPISTIGILLMLLAIVLFILEIKVTSYGMLTVGGVTCLIIGSLMLVEGPIPELRLSPWLVVPVSVAVALFCVVALRFALKAQLAKVGTGVEGLRSEVGTVTEELNPDGKVFVHGETWNASSVEGTIAQGARVRVIRVDDMHLTVAPAER